MVLLFKKYFVTRIPSITFILHIHVSFLPQIHWCNLKTSFEPYWFPFVFILIPIQWESKAFHSREKDLCSYLFHMFHVGDSGIPLVFCLSVCDVSFLSLVFLRVPFCGWGWLSSCLLIFHVKWELTDPSGRNFAPLNCGDTGNKYTFGKDNF